MKTRTLPAGNRSSIHGYTYVIVLAVLVIIGILLEVGNVSNSYKKQRDAEEELIFRGMQYMQAIESYYLAQKNKPAFPQNMEELEKDSRFAQKRHIRRLYNDPITDADWKLVRAPGGGISGVVSSSKNEPLKKQNFRIELKEFTGAGSYDEWIFEYKPPKTNTTPTNPLTPNTIPKPNSPLPVRK